MFASRRTNFKLYLPTKIRMAISVIVLGILTGGIVLYCVLYLSANSNPIDVIVSPKKDSLYRIRLPFLTTGSFEVMVDLPNLSFREVDVLLSKVNASVVPSTRGTIVRANAYSEDVDFDLASKSDGRHFFFSLNAEGFGSGELVFEFQDPKEWPDQVRISVESLSL